MNGDKHQYASTVRRHPDFPANWGRPPGTPYSAERQNWVLRNVMRSNPAARRNARAALQLTRSLRIEIATEASRRLRRRLEELDS